jgi:hypothetical protein
MHSCEEIREGEHTAMSQDPDINNVNVEQKQGYEELQVMGEQLLTRVKELVHEGNVRRLIIKQEGHTILEVPLTVGVVGVLVAPALAAIGAIGALIAQCSIEVIRSERPSDAVNQTVNEVINPTNYDGPSSTL